MAMAARLAQCTPLRAFRLGSAVSVSPRRHERSAARREIEPILRSSDSGTPSFHGRATFRSDTIGSEPGLTAPYRRILFPTDFSQASAAMAPYVTEIARRFNATVTGCARSLQS